MCISSRPREVRKNKSERSGRFAGQRERALYSEKKMESVKERMERIGAYEKIASFMQKEKQPYEFKNMHRSELRNLQMNAMGDCSIITFQSVALTV